MTIDQHRAGSADTVFAAQMSAGQAQLMPQEIRKRCASGDRTRVLSTIDRQIDGVRVGHAPTPAVASIRFHASRNARSVRTRARCRR